MTTKGSFDIEVYPDWSPLGAKRYLELVEDGFYTNIPMYRSVSGFLTQVCTGITRRRREDLLHQCDMYVFMLVRNHREPYT